MEMIEAERRSGGLASEVDILLLSAIKKSGSNGPISSQSAIVSRTMHVLSPKLLGEIERLVDSMPEGRET